MAIYRRTAELVAPIAENAIDCLFGKAAAEATTEGEVQLYAGVTAQFTLALSDLSSLKREVAERQAAAEGMNQ
jgi:hypothetical protein